jgi:membrane-associated phospholipid phosphatase
MAAALVYCRYHWLTDVVGSMLLGLLILRVFCGAVWAPERLRDDPTAQDDALRLREDA